MFPNIKVLDGKLELAFSFFSQYLSKGKFHTSLSELKFQLTSGVNFEFTLLSAVL